MDIENKINVLDEIINEYSVLLKPSPINEVFNNTDIRQKIMRENIWWNTYYKIVRSCIGEFKVGIWRERFTDRLFEIKKIKNPIKYKDHKKITFCYIDTDTGVYSKAITISVKYVWDKNGSAWMFEYFKSKGVMLYAVDLIPPTSNKKYRDIYINTSKGWSQMIKDKKPLSKKI